MGHRIEGNKIIIDFNPDSKTPSNSGKTLILASSNGFIWFGDIGINYNVIKKR